jgi:aspartyl/asparaginyl beta-hydroxylase (cupin superfamily)
MNTPKLWFSLYDFSFNYKGEEPDFVEDEFDWAIDFQKNWLLIRDELNSYLNLHEPEAYFNSSMVNTKNTWKTISLKWWDIEFRKRQAYFPITSSILKKYPELLSLSFNQLEPQGRILPHCGDTNAIYRCHLGLDVPDQLPATGFRVREESRSWEEGKWLVFMDAYNHEAFNQSDRKRVIMVVDVLRPEFKHNRKKVISVVLTSLFLQKRAQQLAFLYKLPHGMIRIVAFPLRPMAYLGMKIVNWLNLY